MTGWCENESNCTLARLAIQTSDKFLERKRVAKRLRFIVISGKKRRVAGSIIELKQSYCSMDREGGFLF
jgi:hypothetical protein